MSEERSQRFSRPAERLIDNANGEEENLNLEEIDVWKLAQFFSGFMKQTLGDVISRIVYDDTPVQVYMDKVLSGLTSGYDISLRELLSNNGQGKAGVIGYFLALLELVRLKKIKLKQTSDFDEIRIASNID